MIPKMFAAKFNFVTILHERVVWLDIVCARGNVMHINSVFVIGGAMDWKYYVAVCCISIRGIFGSCYAWAHTILSL